MTVFHVLGEDEPFSERNGGAISRWAANVLRSGDEVVVCPSSDGSWNFPAERIYRLPYWEQTDPIHPILYRIHWSVQKAVYLRVFGPLLDRMKPGDVLYFHNRPECAPVLAPAARKRGIHVVLHMHNSLLLRASRYQVAALENVPIVFCSRFLADEAQAAWPGRFRKTYLVYNGADGARFTAQPKLSDHIPEIIYTGRLVSYKGVHILLDAMRLLEQKGVAARCSVVGGSGFGRSRPNRYVRMLARTRPSNVELLGYKSGDALVAALRHADLFCAPSTWNDPFPLSVLEAMACGLPVVASKVGGIPEALAYGGGILVPPGDPVALAAALEKLITDPTYRQALSTQALDASQHHFLWSNVRAQYDHVIDHVIDPATDDVLAKAVS